MEIMCKGLFVAGTIGVTINALESVEACKSNCVILAMFFYLTTTLVAGFTTTTFFLTGETDAWVMVSLIMRR